MCRTRINRRVFLGTTLFLAGCNVTEVCDSTPSHDRAPTPIPSGGTLLLRAHSHNDYNQARTLTDALELGISSVEADVVYQKGSIYVGHSSSETKGTLRDLYLAPLQAHFADQPPSPNSSFTLWIDIKENSEELKDALTAELALYSVLKTFGDNAKPGPVTVVLSGNRPAKESLVRNRSRPFVRDSNHFSELDPPADESWSHYALHWNTVLGHHGQEATPTYAKQRLQCIVDGAHALNKQIRFFAAPDREDAWEAQVRAGVDFINTDKIHELRHYLLHFQALSFD